MSNEFHTAARHLGPRGVRLALVSSGVLFLILLGTWAVIAIVAAWQGGHPLRGTILAVAALLLLLLTLRIIAMNWRAMDSQAERPIAPSDGSDQTGIWGVGGPSMREPGSTGAWSVRNFDRRYEERDD